MKNPQRVMKSLDEIRPYEKNPRRNNDAVKYLAKSIKEFGFNQPIVIDKDGVIVAGHTRYKAAEQLGLKAVPCILVSDLTDKQVKAYRLADNKIAEMSAWDFPMLNIELDELADDFDMSDFGFEEDETDVLESLLGSNYVTLNQTVICSA